MAVTLYCTETELDNLLSDFGVLTRTDDADTGSEDESQIGPVIERASVFINLKLFQRYPLSLLTGNTWIKWATAILAAVYLCQRRGNDVPDCLMEAFGETKEQLDAIMNGTLQLPADTGLVAPLYDDTPSVSNFVFNDFYRRAKIRRVPGISSGGNQPSNNGRKQFNEGNWWGGFI